MTIEPQPSASPDPDNRDSSEGGTPFSPLLWLQVLLGLSIASYGFWMLLDRNWHSPTGFLIMCVGFMILPIWVARLLGGLGALGLGVWLIVSALQPPVTMFDLLYGAAVVFVGGSAALEGVRAFRATRRR